MRQQAQRKRRWTGAEPAFKKAPVEKQMKPVQVESALVLKGGHLRKAMSLDPVPFDGQQFVKLSKRESWLCQVAAGKARGLDPLSRTSLTDDLAASLRSKTQEDEQTSAHASQKADPMHALGLDEAVTDDARRASLQQKVTKQPKAKKPNIIMVKAPSYASRASGGPVQVSLLTRPPRGPPLRQGVLLHVDHIPWAVDILLHQVKQGGVDFSPPESKLREPWFALDESSWRCRAKTPSGEIVRKRIMVPLVLDNFVGGGKRVLTKAEYQKMKQEKLDEILEWRERVQQGFSD